MFISKLPLSLKKLITTISSITIFISLFLAFFLITVKEENKLSNYLFSVFLILTAIDTSGIIFDSMTQKPYNLIIFRSTFSFLQIPIFYLYVLSVCYSDFKLKPIHLIHCIAFIIVNLLLLPRFYLVETMEKINFLKHNKHMFEIQFNHILFHLQSVIYITIVFLTLKKVKKIYVENYSGLSIKTYDWLFKFTLTLSFLYFFTLVKNIFKFSEPLYLSAFFKIGIHLFLFILICWYLFKALKNPELFNQINSKLKLVKNIVPIEKDVSTEKKLEEQKSIEKLKRYMINSKPYLNSSLTIQNIADEIEIPVRELSILINHKLNQHFYDFVNFYRINYAKSLLKDTSKNKLTILEILYDAGFNSKSSFNTAFKKHTGTTPTVYRKLLTNSD